MFIKRKAEVHARLDTAVQNMTGREITSKKDQELIRDAVNKYFYLNQKTLEEALSFLKDDTKTAEQQRDRWENHLHTKGSEAVQLLSESIKGKPVTLFITVISEVASHEVSERLRNIYKEGLEEVDVSHIQLKENLALYLKAIRVATASPEIPFSLRLLINNITEALNNFKVTSDDLAYRFEQLYRSEDSVAVIMFGNTRKSVKEFLEKTNLDKARKDYNEAEKHAYDNSKNMLTTGQQEDAALFVKTATDSTKITMQLFTDAYNSFVDSFKEIFIGPVGDRTVNDLINKQRWDWAKNEWQNINIETELKKIYDDSREWVDLDMYELDDETKAEVEKVLANERERLDIALKQAGDPGMLDKLKLYLTLAKDLVYSKIKSN